VVSKVRTGTSRVDGQRTLDSAPHGANTNCPLANFGKEGAELPVIAKVGQE
jgi:hypothetical protein